MFFFGKKNKDKQDLDIKDDAKSKEEDADKQKTRLDKLIMGAIVGVAVGSVIGASMAPKSKKKKENLLKEIPTEDDK